MHIRFIKPKCKNKYMKGINIFLAEGFEDSEAICTYDILSRGGLKPRLIGINDEPFVTSSHGVTVGISDMLPETDCSHEGTSRRDVMIFPGGMPGTKNLAACKPLMKLMKEHYAAGGSLAAICAAPGYVLSQLDEEIINGLEFTCFEGCQDATVAKGGVYNPQPSIRCGRIISGRSAGYAMDFGLEILKFVKEEAVEDVIHGVYLK